MRRRYLITPDAADPSPAGDELASVLVACGNPSLDPRLCLESLLRHTSPPYELIIVDDGEDDDLSAYLKEVAARPGPSRVEVIRGARDVGEAAACIQALAQARGRYLVLLNRDTLVPGGWLEGLIACALRDGPAVGLVGPVSNGAAPPQRVEPDYGDPAGLDAFAIGRRRAYAGRSLDVERLSGPCLLIRREVLDRIGPGSFDDLCDRARAAGFRLRVALDVFVHQGGGRRRPKVSLCLIVKNEEANLPDCLSTAADLVDEIVVVDTGSTDRTREVAARFGARVHEFPWVDDFAAARNESLRHATGEWIFWLDADDRLDEEERGKLRALFAALGAENVAYAMKCLCPSDPSEGSATVVDHVRLFRNDPLIRWKYRVHEQILPAIRRRGGEVRWAGVTIRHVGYQDPALRRSKLERDLRLLRREVSEQPDDPFTLFNLGSVFQELGRTDEALPLLRRSLDLSHPSDSIVRKLYALIVHCLRRLDRGPEALATCRAGLAVAPEDTELLFQEGLILRTLGDRAGSEASLLRLLNTRAGDHFASIDPGLRGYKARHNLAVLYHEQGRAVEAEAQWRAAVAERPEFVPAWLGLGEIGLAQGRWDEVETIARRLDADPSHAIDAAVLRGRAALRRKDFADARRLMEQAIARSPQALLPHVVLSHALLQAGTDRPAAERALRAILALDPVNAEAKHNLAVLLASDSR